MATSKAKRLMGLAQPAPKPQPQRMTSKSSLKAKVDSKTESTGLKPVKAHIYHSIAELNSGFEQVVRELQTLGGLNLFRASSVSAMRAHICRMRAQANRDFALAIHNREKANAGVLQSA